MAKKHKNKTKISYSYTAKECKIMAAALQFLWYDVHVLQDVPMSGSEKSVLFSAYTKMNNYDFENNADESFPLSENELSMAASSIFYVLENIDSDDTDIYEVAPELRDSKELVRLAKRIEANLNGIPANMENFLM